MLDLLIIGGAAAGSPAAIYASRAELKLKLVSMDWGGEVARSGEVWNYPGFNQTTGIELSDVFKKQVEFNNVDIELGVEITDVTKQSDQTFMIEGKKGSEPVSYAARTVIVATGVHPRPLNIPGEETLKNRGLSYCTVCDGPLFKNKEVAIVGGGNSALEAALMMSKIATKVYLITINPELQGESVYINQVMKHPNVELIVNGQTTEVVGEQSVTGLKLKDTQTNQTRDLAVQGVFVHIGLIPNSAFLKGVNKNKFGEIEVDKYASTSIPGLYAAGDVTDIAYKQIGIAAGQGAIAALSAINYLQKMAPTFH